MKKIIALSISIVCYSIIVKAQTTLIIDYPGFDGKVHLVDVFDQNKTLIDTTFQNTLTLDLDYLFSPSVKEIVLEPHFTIGSQKYNLTVFPLLKDSLCKINISKDIKVTYSENRYYDGLQLLADSTFDNALFTNKEALNRRSYLNQKYNEFYENQQRWGLVPLMGLAQYLYTDKSLRIKDDLYFTIDSICKLNDSSLEFLWKEFIYPQILYKEFPKFIEAQDLNNKVRTITFSEIDEWTIVDFWATWCKPCIDGLIKYNEVLDTNKVKVVTISIDKDAGNWQKFVLKNPTFANYENLWDSGKIQADLDFNAVPFSLLFDPHGQLQKINPSVEDIFELIK
jgi:thiol-disulfide isomerase/thioredoxin